MSKPLLKGVLKTWKEDRGFGFITPENGGRDLFIHISALGQPERRPTPGDVIHYHITRDRQGKLRAVNAQIQGVNSQKNSPTTQSENKNKFGWVKIVLWGSIIIAFLIVAAINLDLAKLLG